MNALNCFRTLRTGPSLLLKIGGVSSFSSLTRWSKVVEGLPVDKVLPPERDRTTQAFLGDKLLGTAAASILIKTSNEALSSSVDTGDLTRILSGAVSNVLMAQHVERILPTVKEDFRKFSDWELGTMVEAAVTAVYQHDPDAVTDLAEFLLEQAKRMMDSNCRGRLEALGGVVSSNRKGGSDHAPVFVATAYLNAATKENPQTAKGDSKKHAEMLAASKVLDLLDDNSSSIQPQVRERITAPTTYEEWVPMKIESFERKADESWETWWRRGAFDSKDAFNRAMAASVVFPDIVVAVDSWTRRSEGQPHAVFMVVISEFKGQQTFRVSNISTHVTANQARREIGLQANRWIADLIRDPAAAKKEMLPPPQPSKKKKTKLKAKSPKPKPKPLTWKQERALTKKFSRHKNRIVDKQGKEKPK